MGTTSLEGKRGDFRILLEKFSLHGHEFAKEMLRWMVLSLTGGLLRAWTIPMRTANGPDGLEYGVRTSQHTLP